MKYFSMFSGIGGFELGIKRAEEDYRRLQQEGAGHLPLPDGTPPQLDPCDRGLLSGKETEGIRGCRTDIEERQDRVENYDAENRRNASSHCEETITSNTKRDQSISEINEKRIDDLNDCRRTISSKDSSGALLQNRQMSSNTIPRDMEQIEDDLEIGQSVRQRSDGILRKGNGIRDDETGIRSRSPDADIEEWECIGYSEIDKYAIQIHEKNFGFHNNYGDARKIRYCKLPDFDLVAAGFPCQAFSIAGQRKGFADARGTLFFEIARLLRDKRPGYLLLENVKGLLSHDEGKTFQRILGILADLGYDLQWQVLNSKDFGVPQNRERVFIVGSAGDRPRPEVFPLGEVDGVPQQKNDKRQGSSYMIHNVYGGFGEEEPRIFEETSPTIRTPAGGGHLPMVAQALQTDGQLRSGSSFGTNNPQSHRNIRRLTPVECERLQGFPDNWTEGISDTQRYKCLGNAVTVNVIEAIMTKFMRCNCVANAEVT